MPQDRRSTAGRYQDTPPSFVPADCEGGDMGYYRGDYYRGDYYQGDLFGSLFSGIKRVAGAVIGATPAGQAAKALIPAFKPRPMIPMLPPPGGVGTRIDIPFFPDPSATSYFDPNQVARAGAAGVVCNIKGYRANKSTYVTRGGGTSKYPRQILIHPKGTECVKIRRMNVSNARALRRAIRRATGFKKLAMRVLRLTSPGHKRRFAGFKTRRKKAA